jgi:hypothetical protein
MGSPAGLDHARDLAAEGEETEADAAELEVPVVATGAAADLAAVAVANAELRSAVELRERTSTSHGEAPMP